MSVSLGDLIVTLKGVAAPLLNAVDESKKAMQDMSSEADNTQNFITQNWKQISAATVALGGAFEGFARSQAESNAALARVSIVTGETTEALRQSISSMVDYTFSAHDATRAMDDLISRGVRTKAEFEAILPVVDTLADALGMDIVDVIEVADNALSALGIPLENVGEHMDTITFLAKQTTVEMGALAKAFRNEAPAINELGLSFDDVAVAMAAMEAEGRRGPAAVRGFQEAIKSAEGDVNVFWESLGVANSTLDAQRTALAGAAGLTQQYADANNGVATPLQRLQANLSNLLFQFGGLSDILGKVAPFMMALGPTVSALAAAKATLLPVIAAVSTGFKAMTAVMLANPFALVIAALAAIGVALYVLVDDWSFLTRALKAAWSTIVNLTSGARDAVVQTVQNLVQNVVNFFTGLMQSVKSIFTAIGQFIFGVFQSLFPAVSEKVRETVQNVVGMFTQLRDRAVAIFTDLFTGVTERIRAMFSYVTDTVRNMADRVGSLFGRTRTEVADEIVPAMVDDVVREFREMGSDVATITGAMSSGVRLTVGNMQQVVVQETAIMANDATANFNAMLRDTTTITGTMNREVRAIQGDMTNNWNATNTDTAVRTTQTYDKMSTDVQGIIGTLSTSNLKTFDGFKSLWLSGVGDLVSQTLDKFGSMGKGISSILSSVFGGGGGGASGILGTIGGILGGPVGGAIGGVLGSVASKVKKIFKFADGGIVTGPTMGLLAEAGESEAVIPLSKFEGMMHGMYARGADAGGGNVAGEIRALRESFEMMTAEVVYNTNRLLKVEEDWNRNGLPGVRNERLVGLA
jgi:hypothetical protein